MKIITVEFKNESIEVIDNFVSVNKICQNLGIDKSRQYQKIQSDETYQSELREIEINGITQKVLCIPYNKINGWLFSISVNRVKPEVKQKLIEYKNECFEVLYQHFNNAHATATPTQLDMITPYEVRRDLTTARRLLTIEKKKHRETAEALEAKIKEIKTSEDVLKLKSENTQLKHTMIFLHNRLHEIMTTCSVKDLQKTLTQLTNHFQTLPNLTNSGKNLNTDTIAGHSYWS